MLFVCCSSCTCIGSGFLNAIITEVREKTVANTAIIIVITFVRFTESFVSLIKNGRP